MCLRAWALVTVYDTLGELEEQETKLMDHLDQNSQDAYFYTLSCLV